MPERASIFQGVQVGVETTSGTAVPANKRLTGLSIEPGVRAEVETYRPAGGKFPTVTVIGKEWIEAKIRGPITYTEICYLLSGLLGTATITGTTAKTWTFPLASFAADNPKTYTVEQGSAERAHRFAYGLVTGLNMKFDRSKVEVDGTMMGHALTDGITLTASPADVPLIPIAPSHITAKIADTQGGLTAATNLTRLIALELALTGRFAPVWVLNGSTTFPAHVEVEPKLELKMLVAADVEGMGLLTTMRGNATKFVRIAANGGGNYNMQIDGAFKVTDVDDFSDEDGLFAVRWTMTGVHDGTWAKALAVTVGNEMASL